MIYCYEHCSEVYNLGNAYPELITDKPFTELDENSKFDPISKTFTNVFYAGGGDKTVFTYQKQDYYYWYTDRLLLAMVHGNNGYGLQKYEHFLGESLFYGVE